MRRRNRKIVINNFLAIFFIKSYGILFGMTIPLHMTVGSIAAVLSITHVCLNREWFSSVGKARKTGKLSKRAMWQYRVDLLLIIAWSVCILTGILMGFPTISYSLVGIKDLFVFFVIHLFTAMLSLILVIIHVVQHLDHIKSNFKRRKRTHITENQI